MIYLVRHPKYTHIQGRKWTSYEGRKEGRKSGNEGRIEGRQAGRNEGKEARKERNEGKTGKQAGKKELKAEIHTFSSFCKTVHPNQPAQHTIV